ncbi:hypothetical protein [Streptomyces sp. RPT161]|uniref:hypothetical protein n=1 Tax=Streptomyces sp. RPT161 TaxID=3015993 RepID=UPI0022B86696|nr:hypothetical protein [Streptomyces sp. RPT161]
MPSFQTGSVPHGFTMDETSERIHYKDAMAIPVPPPNHSGFGWKRIWFSLGADHADVRIKVAVHNGTSWTTTNYDVLAVRPRVGFEVAAGTTKLSIGRVKKTATDTNDNSPFSWLLESQA